MSDDFEATVVVETAPEAVWKALTERTLAGDDGGDHYVLPGFPSFEPLPVPGASCTALELEEGRLLRVRKDHQPCQGTEIAIRLEQAGTGTRITVVQSGFGDFLDLAGRDVVFGHGRQIVADLALYVERRIVAPGRVWGAMLGGATRERGYGLEVVRVDPGGFAEKAGLAAGDLLVSLRGVRTYDTTMLTTILALTEAGQEAEVAWIRDGDIVSGKATF